MKKISLSKKLMATAICILLTLSLTACGGNNDSSSNQENTNNGSSNSEYILSSFLENKPVIFYEVKEVSKDAKPSSIYFLNPLKHSVVISLLV